MQIAVTTTAFGRPILRSVLDLEPLLEFTRAARPDAVCLMPPPGPDDLPNGAALAAIKERLDGEGVGVIAGPLTIPSGAPVSDEGWQAQNHFEGQALLAALGEAGINLLVVDWRPSIAANSGYDALQRYLEPLIEEAGHANMRLALRLPNYRACTKLLRGTAIPHVGVCYDLRADSDNVSLSVTHLRELGDKLFAVQAGKPPIATDFDPEPNSIPEGGDWAAVLDGLADLEFSGPLVLDGFRSPVELARTVGWVMGLGACRHAGQYARKPERLRVY